MRVSLLFVVTGLTIGVLSAQQARPVTMLFAGDVTLAGHVEQEAGERVGYVFERWKEVGPYDIFMVNLENAITRATKKVEKEFNFRMHPRYVETLQAAPTSIVNLANNHAWDYGLRGLFDTMGFLDTAGIRYVGAGRSLEEARKPVILAVNGWRIGFLGYSGNGRFSAAISQGGIAPRHEPYVVEDVQKLRESADYVVVSFHWGEELADRPSKEQVRFAHRVVEAGADLIIGHHSHTLQGIERYRGKVIAYSLGNFVFGGNSRHTYATAVLRVVLSGEGPEVELVPIQVSRWQPHPPSPSTRAAIIGQVLERSRIFPQSISISISTGASQ